MTEQTAIEKEMEALKDEPSVTIFLGEEDRGQKDDAPDQAIAQLRAELAATKAAAAQWQQQAHQSNHIAFANAAENARREYAALADKLKDAMERYDATEVANVQLKLTERSRQVTELEDAAQRT